MRGPPRGKECHRSGARTRRGGGFMNDRIVDVWGDRTPYSSGDVWPSRVDTHLSPGLDAAEVDRWVQSACVLCSNGCALDIAVKDDRIVGVRGRGDDRVNRGRL